MPEKDTNTEKSRDRNRQDGPAKSSAKQTRSSGGKERKAKLTDREKRGAEMVLAIALLSLVVYIVIMALIVFFVWYSFTTPSSSASLYSLEAIDAETETKLFSYSAGRANNSYGLYLSYNDLAKYCDFGIAGDSQQITLFLSEKDSIVCYRNSSLLSVNGNTVRISAPVLFEEDDYLLPVSLFESYLSGAEVTYDSAKKICRVSIPENPVFTLTMDRPEAMDKCNEYDLRTVAGENPSEDTSQEPNR